MKILLKNLFQDINSDFAERQNDAIGKLVELLRKNYLRNKETYAYVFLMPTEPLFDLTLSEKDISEVVDEINKMIRSEPAPSTRRASLLWTLGSIFVWQSFEHLAKILQDFSRDMSSEEFYQALVSFDSLMVLGRTNKQKLLQLLKTYNTRDIVKLYATHNRSGLAELAVSILRQISQHEDET